jgi:hypothetical protein
MGQACNHGDNPTYIGRIKLAESLAELSQMLTSNRSVTLAKTFGNFAGIIEVHRFVGQGKLMTVRRQQGQCIACAVQLAHAIGALVVIA